MAAIRQFHFREHWRELKAGRPGSRFQECYAHARQQHGRCGLAQRIMLILVATIFLAIALVLTLAPGPAFVFFILAGALLATESLVVARFMDACEVKVRRIGAWGNRLWRRLTRAAQVAVITLVGCGIIGAGFVAFRVFRGY